MTQDNVEIVRTIYRLWNEGRSPRHLIDPQLEYVNPPDAVETRTRRDRRALASIREVSPEFRVEPERFLDAGEDVVVIGTALGTTKSGAKALWRQGYVWTLRDGVAIRFRWFNHPDEALKAVGLEE